MYRIMIVDDEKNVREGLTSVVDWASLGYEVVACLKDGKEAIEYIEKLPVDVVLTDIKMTFISGIDLARYISENKPHIRVVVVSGYKEFELAMQAVNYGVSHYLLKPTRLKELYTIFRELKQKMDREKEEKESVQRELRQYAELIPLLQEEFFNDLLTGDFSGEEVIEKRMRLAGLQMNPEQCKCCLLGITLHHFDSFVEAWEYGKDNLYTALQNFFRSRAQHIRYFFTGQRGGNIRVVAVAPEELDAGELRRRVQAHISEICKDVKQIFDLDMDIQVVRTFENLYEVSGAGRYARSAPEQKDNESAGTGVNRERKDKLPEQQKLFMSYMNAGNFEAVICLFNGLMDTLDTVDVKTAGNYIIDLMAMVAGKLKDMGIDDYVFAKKRIDYDAVFRCKSVGEVKAWGQEIFRDILRHVQNLRQTAEKNVIQKAKEYIAENFRKDISLEDVANHVFLHAAYFSRLFKQETGENFTDYLIKVRMEKAMKFLQEPQYKVYEVSTLVGYKSTNHFYRLFKSFSGFTPTEYRKNLF